MENKAIRQDKIINSLRIIQSIWTFIILAHLDRIIHLGANKIIFGVHFFAYLLLIFGRFYYTDKNYIRINRRLSVPLNAFLKFLPIVAFVFFVRLPGPTLNILLSGSLLSLDFLLRDYTSWYFTKEELEKFEKKREK